MWHYRYEEDTPLRCEDLWPVLADVARWPEVDRNIECLKIDEEPGPGVTFVLKPKGGPRLNFVIGEFEAPSRYADVCRMPLAVMRTRHTLIPDGLGTRIRVDIEITGPLAPVWGRVVGRRHAAGLPAQTARFIEGARARLNLA
ncbi:SRPBCC family protein [Roseovarius mucosus]|uniref:SRPBCC family protein n=1 Tax=Roseovarius mucosus TaxID=215743 RepID=UPI001C5E1C39|nr:SRPBCC family protein [Roseovarius mucosus]MBW4975093.1 SRPBCC family protein [Roseovarius mucosus]